MHCTIKILTVEYFSQAFDWPDKMQLAFSTSFRYGKTLNIRIRHDVKRCFYSYHLWASRFRMEFVFQQVEHAWDLQKNTNLLKIVAEIGNLKISVADFKTIQPSVSVEDKEIMCSFNKKNGGKGVFHVGWLNDQVRTHISNNKNGHETHYFLGFCFN